MRFRLAHSVLLTAFVSDLDTTVPILPGSAAPDRPGGSGPGGSARPERVARVMRAGVTS